MLTVPNLLGSRLPWGLSPLDESFKINQDNSPKAIGAHSGHKILGPNRRSEWYLLNGCIRLKIPSWPYLARFDPRDAARITGFLSSSSKGREGGWRRSAPSREQDTLVLREGIAEEPIRHEGPTQEEEQGNGKGNEDEEEGPGEG